MSSIPCIQTEKYCHGDCEVILQKRNVITISTQIDQWSKEWGMKLPDMLFGDNQLCIKKKGSDHQLIISPQYVLKNRCKEGSFEALTIHFDTIQIDPSFSVFSDGYHWAFPSLAGAYGFPESSEKEIEGELPWDVLKRRDPILWYCNFLMYQDHLHDFGLITCECKMRVMEDYFYIMQQSFLRIDYQCVYIISHRYFHYYTSSSILHDFSVQRLDWSVVDDQMKHLLFEDIHSVLQFADLCEQQQHHFTSIEFFFVFYLTNNLFCRFRWCNRLNINRTS